MREKAPLSNDGPEAGSTGVVNGTSGLGVSAPFSWGRCIRIVASMRMSCSSTGVIVILLMIGYIDNHGRSCPQSWAATGWFLYTQLHDASDLV
jgi:hypothetical protein